MDFHCRTFYEPSLFFISFNFILLSPSFGFYSLTLRPFQTLVNMLTKKKERKKDEYVVEPTDAYNFFSFFPFLHSFYATYMLLLHSKKKNTPYKFKQWQT